MRKEPLFVSLKTKEKSQVVQEPQEAPTAWKFKTEIPELTEKGNRGSDRPVHRPHEVYNLVAETNMEIINNNTKQIIQQIQAG